MYELDFMATHANKLNHINQRKKVYVDKEKQIALEKEEEKELMKYTLEHVCAILATREILEELDKKVYKMFE